MMFSSLSNQKQIRSDAALVMTSQRQRRWARATRRKKAHEGFLATLGMTVGWWADGSRVEVYCNKGPRPRENRGRPGYKAVRLRAGPADGCAWKKNEGFLTTFGMTVGWWADGSAPLPKAPGTIRYEPTLKNDPSQVQGKRVGHPQNQKQIPRAAARHTPAQPATACGSRVCYKKNL